MTARNQIRVELVKTPAESLISDVRFDKWDGKSGTTVLCGNPVVWIAPDAATAPGRHGGALAVHQNATDSAWKSGVDVNVARAPGTAGLKITGLRMRDNAVTIGVWFKSETADGKLFGKDGRNAFGKAYKAASCELQHGKLLAQPGKIRGGEIRAGQWSHVVLTADAGSTKLYLNGALVGQGEGSPSLVTDALDFFSNHPASVDEIRIYDAALPPEAIRQWYEASSISKTHTNP